MLSCAPPNQSLNSTTAITDQSTMDHPQSNPEQQDHPNSPDENPVSSPAPRPSLNIESLLPSASANQLLELISRGHSPENLHTLIESSNKAA